MRGLRKWALVMVFLLLASAVAGCAKSGEKFPNKPIQFQVVFPAGGPSDTEARLVAKYAEKYLKGNIVITNVGGAGGSIGWNKVPDMSKDGHNITVYNLPHIVTQPLVSDVKFTYKTFAPIVHWGQDNTVFAVLADSPYKTLKDVVEASKQKPASITVGMAGQWLGHHVAVLMLEDSAGIDLKDMPFQGSAPSIQALLGGHIDLIAENMSSMIRQGDRVRILAVASAKRDSLSPDVPTVEELGYKGVISSSDRGVAAPADIDPEALKILREGFYKAVTDKKFQEELRKLGAEPYIVKGAEMQKIFQQQQADIEKLLTRLNLIKK